MQHRIGNNTKMEVVNAGYLPNSESARSLSTTNLRWPRVAIKSENSKAKIDFQSKNSKLKVDC